MCVMLIYKFEVFIMVKYTVGSPRQKSYIPYIAIISDLLAFGCCKINNSDNKD